MLRREKEITNIYVALKEKYLKYKYYFYFYTQYSSQQSMKDEILLDVIFIL